MPPSEWLRLNLKRGTGKRLPEEVWRGGVGEDLPGRTTLGRQHPDFKLLETSAVWCSWLACRDW